ncbi:cell division protein FtsZ [candidate division WWE3 bacterium RIFOXYC1_FULL_40_10]|uniref:Cell division protein FtsZ n=1 Tax=candidate division WWE3 bacterium RIFOXYA2_FULL_46_9 TaxID=1802636 RepID=A0A1F4W2W9_UNCKA|nr:MAG: cell division protein FtsZ [candidate division WWE3 bacterium RIFOXYB1_FULL_40_22]OGC61758.1 MAG: cell division protein FtsZ [candidate division WWE3 bacterium RIFOXYA1_FULL_40_11]OGC63741.1 MAG: cell division protein FtsZ [candidate division WWE3 bacterium RIFOXYA2_FULL_46_9]OGC65192.1 MAG: cell division protein FtsZ [candidate division WWE3 bacterium RIFOXYB2_FULL_41_6]OGC66141.1 MAG: cell division protein FtsZ [candidate division WWE3 bacterium RIFOXYC1_FULL_40_10]OGC67537.1 MAG: ce
MLVKPEIERFARIKVVGVGGAGGNVINSMIESDQISGVEYVAINTDAQDLSINKSVVKIPIGQKLTNGLGAGANPEVGRAAAEESTDLIKENLEGADMVFITAGMGGGTGTGASPVVASIARELGALTIGVVTKPFEFEGAQRKTNAQKGISELKTQVDALITIPNQKLLEISDENTSIMEAFKMSDSILNQGVQGISDLIVMPGLINVDFADVKTIMKGAGTALMGIGIGTGENRAEKAARDAISSPLIEQSIEGATGILFNIVGGIDLSMKEVDKAANIIRDIARQDANIIFGTSIDRRLDGQVKITVIATGFDAYEGGKDDFGFSAPTRPKSFAVDEVLKNAQTQGVTKPAVPVEPIHKHVPPKNVFKPEDFDGDFDDKYDIPAFLRGR